MSAHAFDVIVAELLARDRAARAMLIERSGVTPVELWAAAEVLAKLAAVDLDDLLVPPGFVLLPDGSVGEANTRTPEWRFWARCNDLVDDSRRLHHELLRAREEAISLTASSQKTPVP